MKISFFIYFTIPLFLISCSNKEENTKLNSSQKLEIALYQGFHHFQSFNEIKLFKKYKVKSASYIKEIPKDNKIDSTTFLVFDKEGRVKSKTTSECTTVGCLPYIIRQEFIYKNNQLIQMKDFSYKKKYKTTLPYWTLSDTNKLSKFDWEDYTYQQNSIRIESGPFIWIYKKNAKGNIIKVVDSIKTNNQTSISNLKYSDSSITILIQNSIQDSTLKIIYKIKNDKVILTNSTNSTQFIFDSKGLLTEKLQYKNNKLLSKTKINYTYFK